MKNVAQLKVKETKERQAVIAALLKIGFVEVSENGEAPLYMADAKTKSGEFVAMAVGDHEITTFQAVITMFGQMSFRIGRRDYETALAYQWIAQDVMAEANAYFEASAVKKTVNG